MKLRPQVSQLEHVSQDGHPAVSPALGQHLQGRPHGLGIGVVRVVQDGDLSLLDHVHPHFRGDEGPDALGQLLPGHAELLPHGAGHEDGVDHVPPQGGDGHGKLALGGLYRAGQALGPQLLDVPGLVGGLALFPAEEDGGGDLPLQGAQQGIVPVQHRQILFGHGAEDFALGLEDILPAAQVFNVGVPDVGDHRHVGADNLGEVVDLSEVVHPHLQHADLVFAGEPEEGQGKAQLVVEVPFGFQHPVLHPQHRGDHVLGGGLAHAAGDADYRDGEPVLIGPGHLADGLHGAGHPDVKLPGQQRLRHLLGEAPGRSVFQSAGDVPVAVGLLPPQGHKQRPGVNGPAVGLHRRDRRLQVRPGPQKGPAGSRQQLPDCHRFHSPPPCAVCLVTFPPCGPPGTRQ